MRDNKYTCFMNSLTEYVKLVMKKMLAKDKYYLFRDVQISWVSKVNDSAQQMVQPDIDELDIEKIKIGCKKYTYRDVDIWTKGLIEGNPVKNIYIFVVYEISHLDERILDTAIGTNTGAIFDQYIFKRCLDINIIMYSYIRNIMEEYNMPDISLFTALSAEKYESNDCVAGMCFINNSISEIKLEYIFGTDIYLDDESNIRVIRKLMEIVNHSELMLAVQYKEEIDSWKITGLVSNRLENKDVIIWFNGKMSWSMSIGIEEQFKFAKGKYELNIGDSEEERLDNLVSTVDENYKCTVKEIVRILQQQKHGTSAILLDGNCIKREVDRLCNVNRGIPVYPFDFRTGDRNKIGLTNIDGALLLDENGICYAIGIIVDGKVIKKGENGRGARYNSIDNYICWLKREMYPESSPIGIVVSEDGMVDVIQAN